MELCVERELGELLLCEGDEGELGELGEDEALGMDGEELLLELLCCCSRQPPSNNPVLTASAKAARDRVDDCTDHTCLAAKVTLALWWAGLLLTWLRSLITLPRWGPDSAPAELGTDACKVRIHCTLIEPLCSDFSDMRSR